MQFPTIIVVELSSATVSSERVEVEYRYPNDTVQ